MVPFDIDRAHSVGFELQPTLFQLLDLAGEVVAVVEDDNVGLFGKQRGLEEEESTQNAEQGAGEPTP